ncbi:isochorismatase family protein [Aeromonas simiae]|uniref:isochorismatase family protein n=1 Tax=Aeromonas simiae TaxID=218936 RepID=UPI0005A95C32|nr:isochorismatase family protein [Aeromonas simiae]MDO2947479.1 isochorismatase family protein [Aeromonas simiae]MDO2951571.1 isochorismatase family protein [Aeromonas simiae]MDO2955039.1 isochorismatase family protein [Aeromonas simiae]
MDVLLVIDMQRGLFEQPRRNDKQVIGNINRLARSVRAQAGHVLYVQHDGLPGEEIAVGTPGWALHPDLEVDEADGHLRKSACDSFLGTDLAARLRILAPRRLLITGCATDFCVDTTLRSAAALGFNVVAVSDAHTTADRPHFSAEQIIDHHHWMWQGLILPAGKHVTLLPTDQLV